MNRIFKEFLNRIRSEILFAKGQRLAKNGKLDEAITAYTKAIKHRPYYSGLYLHLGLALAERDKPAEAVDSVLKAIRLSPKNTVFGIFLAMIYIDQGKYDDALETLSKKTKIDDGNEVAFGYEALAYLAKGDIERGLSIIKKRGADNQFHFLRRLFMSILSSLNRVGLKNKFMETGDICVVASPPHFQARLLMWAENFLINKDKGHGIGLKAYKIEDQEIDFNDHDKSFSKELWYRKLLLVLKARSCIANGKRYMERNEYRMAISKFGRALSLYPVEKNVYSAIGECHFHLSEYGFAKQYFERGLLETPDNAVDLYFIGAIFYKLADFSKSLDYLIRADESEPEFPELCYYMGLNYLRKGDILNARHQFVKVVTEDCNFVDTRINAVLDALCGAA